MDATIKGLYEQKLISIETALSRVKNPAEFQLLGKPELKRRLWSDRP
jgi:hypothetical protein